MRNGMRARALFWTLGATVGVGIAQPACFGADWISTSTGNASTTEDASTEDTSIADTPSDVQSSDGCDLTLEPKDAPQCVVNEYGAFVSSETGNDDNPGTKEYPLATIGKALAVAAQQSKPRVYVCGTGTLQESVQIVGATSVSGIYGGFVCSNWEYNYDTDSKAHVVPATTGVALSLLHRPSAITIADLAFAVQSAQTPGESSVAVLVNQSNVTFKRCDLKAANGMKGGGGKGGEVDNPNYPPSTTTAPSGNDAVYDMAMGAATQTCAANPCADHSTSSGGRGGYGGDVPTNGEPGTPNNGGGNGGTGSTDLHCGEGGAGAAGVAGAAGTVPTAGAPGTVTSGSGSLTSDGIWIPAWSVIGKVGGIGQGGGGGGGTTYLYTGGGGGGCGGCGGSPGSAAQAGGASIALISYKSQVALNACTLTAGQAGAGGKGALGQVGQYGGNGGYASYGCQGGYGGSGGNGGASAGGAGGIAAGILWLGDASQAPTPDDATNSNINPGYKGLGGTGGNPGSNDGLAGVSGPVLLVRQ
ncbi:MAG: hypothetical protein FWD69_14895 [Polyangiaceae bacterium]|nr:hypothetical protein [Polyangiaceae bacterium]